MAGRRWEIVEPAGGKSEALVRVEGRHLVYYCRSLCEALDSPTRSRPWTLVAMNQTRRKKKLAKMCKGCHGNLTHSEFVWVVFILQD